ncbi:transport protein Avl9-domain-containing protein [Macrophomina phaseolina]|uniref:Transport protein Avl9-domain-containing protein n=1 Tax=Macrophomina phaseolina TaxID=35725 RepID=A0ABQ8FQI8_9PEZI|nr:transport protein Avl9-domain-containing protein [Macrophomina phaseolina]
MAHRPPFPPIVCIVDFHHARGPEVETWLGVENGSDPSAENDWPLLPFMALSDGAHAATEDFSYFTLRHEQTPDSPATSLFGISCTHQLDANELINRPADVTRSTVQKAVVVISDSPQHFGHLREKLSVVTKAWFAQRDFTDLDILQRFQESLAKTFKDREHERDQFFGLSLREIIHEFKHQTLVLFKCCLLQPKMLFFGSQCERLCLLQFSLVSLIPGLIRQLHDCADPAFNSYEENLQRPTSLKTSERASLLAYMGLPLQLFGKGSLFGPYTPLQQLDLLADRDTKSYIVGSTNSLLLQQKDRYSDILINLDEDTITISSTSLRSALALSTPDRRWIDFLTQQVNDTWDENNPGRPNTLGYAGSEEFIRLQFEEYLLALLSTTKYRVYREAHKDNPKGPVIDEIDGDPSSEFNNDFINAWMRTENFRIFNQNTDDHLFDIVVPEHPCSGGLTIEDVQRRLNAQVEALHLDERFAHSKEAFNKHVAEGQKKVSTAFNNLWNDIEAMREAQRKKAEEDRRIAAEKAAAEEKDGRNSPVANSTRSERASAYLSSWSQWAAEKRAGWRRSASSEKSPSSPVPLASPTESKAPSEKDKKSFEEKPKTASFEEESPKKILEDGPNAAATEHSIPTSRVADENEADDAKHVETLEEREEREKTELDEEVERARQAWGAA